VLKHIATRYMSRGFRETLRNVAVEARVQRRHRRGLRAARRYRGADRLKIQLGSGGQRKDGWVNVDLFADADVHLDLREDLPFADGSAVLVYAEHVLEHFIYPREVQHIAREVKRILAPGGMFKLVVPDAGRALKAYGRDERPFFAARHVRSYLASEKPTPMHIVNYIFRQDGQHKYAYDDETLAQVLEDAGFIDVRQRPFDPALDSARRVAVNSLYMEATKPAAIGRQ
jgi:predicted SAM-dependent methyltransferase